MIVLFKKIKLLFFFNMFPDPYRFFSTEIFLFLLDWLLYSSTDTLTAYFFLTDVFLY